MKAKYAVLLLAAGYALDFWGTLRKITHGAGADTFFLPAAGFEIAGVLLPACKLIRYEAEGF